MSDDLNELLSLLQGVIDKKLDIDPEILANDVLSIASKITTEDESELFPIMILVVDYLVTKGIQVKFDTEDFLNEIIH